MKKNLYKVTSSWLLPEMLSGAEPLEYYGNMPEDFIIASSPEDAIKKATELCLAGSDGKAKLEASGFVVYRESWGIRGAVGGFKAVEIESKDSYVYDSYTSWQDGEYVTTTKVYDTDKLVPGWTGCHWDNPAIIVSESIEGTNISDEMLEIIKKLGAVELEELEETDDAEYFSPPSEAEEDDWSIEELLEKGYLNG